jgi:hypothetical protein
MIGGRPGRRGGGAQPDVGEKVAHDSGGEGGTGGVQPGLRQQRTARSPAADGGQVASSWRMGVDWWEVEPPGEVFF